MFPAFSCDYDCPVNGFRAQVAKASATTATSAAAIHADGSSFGNYKTIGTCNST